MNNSNQEIQLLETIFAKDSTNNEESAFSQRELASTAGLSLGMTNTLIKRFIERGWVKLMHINGRKVKYALTPEGMDEIAFRAVDYFARAVQNASLYRNKVESFVRGMAGQGYMSLLLASPLELDFLFEYACLKYCVSFYKVAAVAKLQPFLHDEKLVVVQGNVHQHAVDRQEAALLAKLELPSSTRIITFSEILSFHNKEYGSN